MWTAMEPTIASSASSAPRWPVTIQTRSPTPTTTASVTATSHQRGVPAPSDVASGTVMPAATLVEMLTSRTIDSPVGPLTIAGTDGVVHHLRMDAQSYPPKGQDAWRNDDGSFGEAVDQLEA